MNCGFKALSALVRRSANEGHCTDLGAGLVTDSRLDDWLEDASFSLPGHKAKTEKNKKG